MANRYTDRKPLEHRRLLARERQRRLRAKKKSLFGKTFNHISLKDLEETSAPPTAST